MRFRCIETKQTPCAWCGCEHLIDFSFHKILLAAAPFGCLANRADDETTRSRRIHTALRSAEEASNSRFRKLIIVSVVWENQPRSALCHIQCGTGLRQGRAWTRFQVSIHGVDGRWRALVGALLISHVESDIFKASVDDHGNCSKPITYGHRFVPFSLLARYFVDESCDEGWTSNKLP